MKTGKISERVVNVCERAVRSAVRFLCAAPLALVPFAPSWGAEFTPYVPESESPSGVWGGSAWGAPGASLQNWRDPESGDEYEEMPDEAYINNPCTTCMSEQGASDLMEVDDFDAYLACLDAIYDQGVLPVDEDGDGKADYYEFPGCGDKDCPLHHLGGWAADENGEISDVKNPGMGIDVEKPRLPIGSPVVMLLMAGGYAALRIRRKQEVNE